MGKKAGDLIWEKCNGINHNDPSHKNYRLELGKFCPSPKKQVENQNQERVIHSIVGSEKLNIHFFFTQSLEISLRKDSSLHILSETIFRDVGSILII